MKKLLVSFLGVSVVALWCSASADVVKPSDPSLAGLPYPGAIKNPCEQGQVNFDGRCRVPGFFKRFVSNDAEPYTILGSATKDRDPGVILTQTLRPGMVEVLSVLPENVAGKPKLPAKHYIADYEIGAISSITTSLSDDGLPQITLFVQSPGGYSLGPSDQQVPSRPDHRPRVSAGRTAGPLAPFGLTYWKLILGWPYEYWSWGTDLCKDSDDCGPEHTTAMASSSHASETEFCDVTGAWAGDAAGSVVVGVGMIESFKAGLNAAAIVFLAGGKGKAAAGAALGAGGSVYYAGEKLAYWQAERTSETVALSVGWGCNALLVAMENDDPEEPDPPNLLGPDLGDTGIDEPCTGGMVEWTGEVKDCGHGESTPITGTTVLDTGETVEETGVEFECATKHAENECAIIIE